MDAESGIVSMPNCTPTDRQDPSWLGQVRLGSSYIVGTLVLIASAKSSGPKDPYGVLYGPEWRTSVGRRTPEYLSPSLFGSERVCTLNHPAVDQFPSQDSCPCALGENFNSFFKCLSTWHIDFNHM